MFDYFRNERRQELNQKMMWRMRIRSLISKCKTFALTFRACKNWPELALARYGWYHPEAPVIRRDGLVIKSKSGLHKGWGEIFEPFVINVYGISRVRNIDVVIDVGANIGAFSVLAARMHPGAKLYAFEPNQTALPVLNQNLTANAVCDIVIIAKPVAGSVKKVTFSDLGDGGSSGFLLKGDKPREMETVTLNSVNWDGCFAAFIKLDCEGAEGEIINWLCANRNKLPCTIHIACEYHPWCPVAIQESINKLRSKGFLVCERKILQETYLFAHIVA